MAYVRNKQQEWNIINDKGKLLSPNKWFSKIYKTDGNICCVCKNQIYILDKNFKLHYLLM